MKIAREIKAALEECGLPYTIEPTKRHAMIRIAGRAVCTVSRDGGESCRRANRNAIKDIQRAIRQMQGA